MPKRSNNTNLDSRQTLIVEAITLFQKQGYFATGVSEILSASGVPKGSLYHHFPGGKSDLAAACVNTLCEQVVRYIQKIGEQKNAYPLLLSTFGKEVKAWLKMNKWGGGSLFATLSHEAKPDEVVLRRALKASYQRIQDALLPLLDEQSLDPAAAKKMAQHTLLSLEGSISLSAALQDHSPLKNTEESLLKLLATYQP